MWNKTRVFKAETFYCWSVKMLMVYFYASSLQEALGDLTDTLSNCSNKRVAWAGSVAYEALEEVSCDCLLLLLSLTLVFFHSESKLRTLPSFTMQPPFPCLEIGTFKITTALLLFDKFSFICLSFGIFWLTDTISDKPNNSVTSLTADRSLLLLILIVSVFHPIPEVLLKKGKK